MEEQEEEEVFYDAEEGEEMVPEPTGLPKVTVEEVETKACVFLGSSEKFQDVSTIQVPPAFVGMGFSCEANKIKTENRVPVDAFRFGANSFEKSDIKNDSSLVCVEKPPSSTSWDAVGPFPHEKDYEAYMKEFPEEDCPKEYSPQEDYPEGFSEEYNPQEYSPEGCYPQEGFSDVNSFRGGNGKTFLERMREQAQACADAGYNNTRPFRRVRRQPANQNHSQGGSCSHWEQ